MKNKTTTHSCTNQTRFVLCVCNQLWDSSNVFSLWPFESLSHQTCPQEKLLVLWPGEKRAWGADHSVTSSCVGQSLQTSLRSLGLRIQSPSQSCSNRFTIMIIIEKNPQQNFRAQTLSNTKTDFTVQRFLVHLTNTHIILSYFIRPTELPALRMLRFVWCWIRSSSSSWSFFLLHNLQV